MKSARNYHGPLVVLTPEQVARVFCWAADDLHPDHITTALRAQCEAALNAASQTPRKGTP